MCFSHNDVCFYVMQVEDCSELAFLVWLTKIIRLKDQSTGCKILLDQLVTWTPKKRPEANQLHVENMYFPGNSCRTAFPAPVSYIRHKGAAGVGRLCSLTSRWNRSLSSLQVYGFDISHPSDGAIVPLHPAVHLHTFCPAAAPHKGWLVVWCSSTQLPSVEAPT